MTDLYLCIFESNMLPYNLSQFSIYNYLNIKRFELKLKIGTSLINALSLIIISQ